MTGLSRASSMQAPIRRLRGADRMGLGSSRRGVARPTGVLPRLADITYLIGSGIGMDLSRRDVRQHDADVPSSDRDDPIGVLKPRRRLFTADRRVGTVRIASRGPHGRQYDEVNAGQV